jgi:tetratricopeptide (TPR) repeat protein
VQGPRVPHGGPQPLRRPGVSALADFFEAIRLSPRFAEAYANGGVIREELEDFAGALADYNTALSLNHRLSDLHARRAGVLCSLGDEAAARADCYLALAGNGLSAAAHANLGAALHLAKCFSGAIAAYSRALELDPGLCWVFVQRGNAHHHCGNWQGMYEDYRRAFSLDAGIAARVAVRTLVRRLRRTPQPGCRSAMSISRGTQTTFSVTLAGA